MMHSLNLQRFVCLGVLALFVGAPIAALSDESHVWVNNRTTDGWAFVTEFHYVGGGCTVHTIPGTMPGAPPSCSSKHYTADHSWCVAPGTQMKRGFPFHVQDVRVEVTMTPNCRQPIVFDWRLPFKRTGAISINNFELDGKNGHYSFVNRP